VARSENDRLVHDRAHPPLVDLAHCEDPHSGGAHEPRLFGIDAPRADQHTIFRVNLRRETSDPRQFRRSIAEDYGKGHPVNISGW
jgi:hypothetical protein